MQAIMCVMILYSKFIQSTFYGIMSLRNAEAISIKFYQHKYVNMSLKVQQ